MLNSLNSIKLKLAAPFVKAIKPLAIVAVLATSAATLTGCNDAQAGGLLGGGIGALAGQAIGHSTTATLLGLGIGAGAGYILGNESDKDRYRHYDRYDHYDHGRYEYRDDYYPYRDRGCCRGYYDY